MSCESDYEFWEDYERRPALKAPKSHVEVKVINSPPPEANTSKPISARQSKSPRPATPLLHQPAAASPSQPAATSPSQPTLSPSPQPSQPHSPKSVMPSDLSDSPDPELQGTLKQDSGPAQRTRTPRVLDPQERQLQAKHDDLLAENQQLQSEALRLRTLVYEQETELSRLRVLLRAPKETHKQMQWTEPSTDTQVLQTQMAAFTDLLEYYEQQTESYKQAKDKMAAELEGIRGVHNTELARIREEHRSHELHIQRECERLQGE